MKNLCRFFLEGKCKFGSKCKYDHVRFSSLVDPPQWIYSSYNGLDMMEISPEEARFALMCGDMKEVLDNFWIKNYVVVCNEMDMLERDARIESVTNRYVDARKFPDVFMAPFDGDRVLSTIRRLREESVSYNKGGSGGYGRDRWSSTGSLGTGQSYDRGGYRDRGQHQVFGGEGGRQFERGPVYGQRPGDGVNWSRGEPYGKAEGRKPRKEHEGRSRGREGGYGQQGGWGREKAGPGEEFDMQEMPRTGGWNGRGGGGDRRGFDNRQGGAGPGEGETDFIEEDFEYGKIPYSYRKSSE